MSTSKDMSELHYNRPGLDQIKFRIGKQGQILERLMDRISEESLPDGDFINERPLRKLSTRSSEDPTIALLDSWSVALDVLGFYQERIANEGFIRTSIERRSVQEQASSIGYQLKPGVASSTYLTFEVKETPDAPKEVDVSEGTKIMSLPSQDQLPQIFETVDNFIARSELNNLKPEIKVRQIISKDTKGLYLKGINVNLQEGDRVLLIGKNSDNSKQSFIRTILNKTVYSEKGYTYVSWKKSLGELTNSGEVVWSFYKFNQKNRLFGVDAPLWDDVCKDEKNIKVISISSDGSTMVTVDLENRILLWKIGSKEFISEVHSDFDHINAVALNDNGSIVAVSSARGGVKLYLPGEQIRDVNINCLDMAFSGNGKFLVMLKSDNSILTYDVNNIEIKQSESLKSLITSFSVNRTASIIVVGTKNGNLVRFDRGDYDYSKVTIKQNIGEITDVCLDYNETMILTASKEGKVYLVDIYKKEFIHLVYDVAGSYCINVKFPKFASPKWNDGNSYDRLKAFFAVCADGSLRTYILKAVNSREYYYEVESYPGIAIDTTANTFCYDGSIFISANTETLSQFQTNNGEKQLDYFIPLGPDYIGDWDNFRYKGNYIDLDRENSSIVEDSLIVVEDSTNEKAARVLSNQLVQRSDFMLNAKVSRLTLDNNQNLQIFSPRESVVYCKSENLNLVDYPTKWEGPLEGDSITFETVVPSLEVGQKMVLTGSKIRLKMGKIKQGDSWILQSEELAQEAELLEGDELILLKTPTYKNVSANNSAIKVWELENKIKFQGNIEIPLGKEPWSYLSAEEEQETVSELITIKEIEHSQENSTIKLSSPLKYSYDPQTVSLNGNVVYATHGETTTEILGSGDGAQISQSFKLKKIPLTYVSADTISGTKTTLQIRVNEVLWEEIDYLYNAGPKDRVYVVRIDDDGTTGVTFGDGIHGERLPTGQENIVAQYRSGIGKAGNVGAETLKLLQTRPLGIKSVINPLASDGGADPESRDQAAKLAPLSVLTLDRIVSIKDFEYFATSYPGIGKVYAVDFLRKGKKIIHLSIAKDDGEVPNKDSQLFSTLLSSIVKVSVPGHQVIIDPYKRIYFNIAAKIKVDPNFQSETVLKNAEDAIRSLFDFENREFGQSVTSSEIISIVQSVDGVTVLDLDHLYRSDSMLFSMNSKPVTEKISIAEKNDFREYVEEFNSSLQQLGLKRLDENLSIVIEEKDNLRWLIEGPEINSSDSKITYSYAIIKDSGKYSVYPFRKILIPKLDANFTEMREDNTFSVAQILLLNPGKVGVILSEQ